MATIIRTILVPTDFSPQSDEALRYAAGLATSLEASILLVHVIEAPFVAGGGWELYVRDVQELRERIYSDVRARLSTLAAGLAQQGIRVTTDIRVGPARDGIVNATIEPGADLIVMSTHGRSGLPHLLLGSVAEHVIRAAQCPVLTVREAFAQSARLGKTTTAA